MGFEWTVKFGDVLTMLGALIVAAAFLYTRVGQEVNMQFSLRELTKELTEMKTEFKTFGETLKMVAVQEVKIGLLMKWYDELRHGEGFVAGNRRGIDGEYPSRE